MMKTLNWSICGEFICDLARTWFWHENKTYEKAEELLLTALGTDEISLNEKKVIVRDILEGKKKLIGTNTFELVEDNERVRPIQEKVTELQGNLLEAEIERDMELYPMNYIDPYATIKPIESAKAGKAHSYQDVYDYFCFSDRDYLKKNDLTKGYPDTQCGLWLLNRCNAKKLIARCYGKIAPAFATAEADAFWETIYEQIKGKEEPGFKKRNQRYLATKRMQKTPTKTEQKRQQGKSSEKSISDMAPEEFILHIINRRPGSLDVRVIPDDMEKFEGLIRPDGAFFSCEFGGHNAKAFYYIAAYYKEFGFTSRNEVYEKVPMDQALDNLIDAGWIATRYLPSMGNYISAKQDICFKPTKEQKDTAWNAIVKHNCRVSNTEMIL